MTQRDGKNLGYVEAHRLTIEGKRRGPDGRLYGESEWEEMERNLKGQIDVEGVEMDPEFEEIVDSWAGERTVDSVLDAISAPHELDEPEIKVWLPWGQVQEEILDAVLLDSAETPEEKWDGDNLKGLAKRLRTTIEELIQYRELTPDEIWYHHRMERLLELEKLAKRGFSWDRLENAALSKLMTLVFEGKINKAGDLLAVARVANVATRRPLDPSANPTGHGGGGLNVQVNMFGQAVPSGGLPGPGNLGSIKLNLSQRTVQQLSQGKTIDGEVTKLSETIEMLGSNDIKELTGLADSEDE